MRPSCACCGTRFTPRQRHQRYCSPRCRSTARKRRQRNTPDTHHGAITARVCFQCGHEFTPTRANQWACSQTCKILASAKRARLQINLRNDLARTLAELHQPHNGHCRYCRHTWPCPEHEILKPHLPLTGPQKPAQGRRAHNPHPHPKRPSSVRTGTHLPTTGVWEHPRPALPRPQMCVHNC